jgi:hypothetical protein
VELNPLTVQTLRYEHDTFVSVVKNADELVNSVRKLQKPDTLYLVAHSRRGIVARLAARELTNLGYRVIVRTYGTPHLGTPLANIGWRFLRTLASGRSAVGGVFSWDPASLAGKLLLKAQELSGDLPSGLDFMRTDSGAVEMLLHGLRCDADNFELYSYGGEYDLRKLADGTCAYLLGEITHEGFGQESNDLVVPTASALGAGTGRRVMGPCDHFHYFSNSTLKQELQDLH